MYRALQIYALRELHEELTALLSQEEASALGLELVFSPFAQLAALHVSEFTAPAWASAEAEHERRLEVVTARISQKLKELFGRQTQACDFTKPIQGILHRAADNLPVR